MKVITFGALCDSQLILSVLDDAVNDGHWLVFNNCHLLEQWDDTVVAQLSQLISSFKGRLPIKDQFILLLDQMLTIKYFPLCIYLLTCLYACESITQISDVRLTHASDCGL